MSRSQSPGYPHIPLSKAIDKAEQVFEEDRTNSIDRLSAANHLGYSGLNGAADKMLATLAHYGLLEPAGKGQTKITSLGMDIFAPASEESKKVALYEAGKMPNVFQMIDSHFESRPSEGALKNWLIRENFQDRAIQPLLKSYFRTLDFLKQEGAIESGSPSSSESANIDVPDNNDVVYGGAKVGDLIQWEVDGVLKLEKPMRVRLVTDDGWIAVEDSKTGIPMSEVIVQNEAGGRAQPPIGVAPPVFALEAKPTESEPKSKEENQIKIALNGNLVNIHCDNVTEDGLEVLLKKLAKYKEILAIN